MHGYQQWVCMSAAHLPWDRVLAGGELDVGWERPSWEMRNAPPIPITLSSPQERTGVEGKGGGER